MQHPDWPVFELIEVTAPPGTSLTLPSLLVPRSYFRYQADAYLGLLRHAGPTRFASVRLLAHDICYLLP